MLCGWSSFIKGETLLRTSQESALKHGRPFLCGEVLFGCPFYPLPKKQDYQFFPLHTLSLFSAGDVHLGAHHDVLRLALDGPPVEPPSGSCYENRQGLEAPSTPMQS